MSDAIEVAVKGLLHKVNLENKNVFIFGSTSYFVRFAYYLKEYGINVVAHLDNNKDVQNTTKNGVPVISPEEVTIEEDIRVIIYSRYEVEMINQLRQLGASDDNIINLHFLRDISFEEGIFGDSYYEGQIKLLEQGEKIYNRIKSEGERLIIVPNSFCLGDLFIIMCFFAEYVKNNHIESYRLVMEKGASKEAILQLFSEKNYSTLERGDLWTLTRYVFVVGEKELDAKCIMPFYRTYRNVQTAHIIPEMSLQEAAGRHWLFISNLDKAYRTPAYLEEPEENLIDAGLKKGKSVILAPYAQSNTMLSRELWEKLTDCLVEKGYEVFTNVSGDNEEAIKGTKEIFIPIIKLKPYLEYAGYFVSIRSGLCDITSSISKCRQVVLYGEGYESGFDIVDSMTDGNLNLSFVQGDIVQISTVNKPTEMIVDEIVSGLDI
ncbi:MAG: hypothetical protein K5639_02680 [Eubacterium sp.]|nr:hypothetical protein [Eubacterium sp.]